MKRRSLCAAVVVGLLSAVVIGDGASAHPTQSASVLTTPPSATFSSSGDYASDVLGDPWDFSDENDVPPIMTVGTEGSFGISVGAGVLTVDAQPRLDDQARSLVGRRASLGSRWSAEADRCFDLHTPVVLDEHQREEEHGRAVLL